MPNFAVSIRTLHEEISKLHSKVKRLWTTRGQAGVLAFEETRNELIGLKSKWFTRLEELEARVTALENDRRVLETPPVGPERTGGRSYS